MSERRQVTLSYSDTRIISLSWNEYWRGEDCLRVCTFDPEVQIEEGDEISVRFTGGIPRLRVVRYEDALLEPEGEIFT